MSSDLISRLEIPWAGIVFGTISYGLSYFAKSTSQTYQQISNAPFLNTHQVRALLKNKDQIYAKIQGTAEPLSEKEQPNRAQAVLTSQFTSQQVLMAKLIVQRKYEQKVISEKPDGTRVQKWVEKSENLQTTHRYVQFILQDAKGSIQVIPQGADIDYLTLYDQTNIPLAQGQSFIVNVNTSSNPSQPLLGESERRDKSFHFTELGIPSGSKLFVIGEIRKSSDGTIIICRPSSEKEPFIITTKSETDILVKTNLKAKRLLWWSNAIGYLGAAFAAYSILSSTFQFSIFSSSNQRDTVSNMRQQRKNDYY